MSNFPLPLLEGETVLKQDEKALYIKSTLGIGYHILHGKLWLTNARLVHQDFPLSRITAYPLNHITTAERESVNVAEKKFEIKGVYTSWTSYNSALMVAFDNNGMDYFIPQDIDSWTQAITQAIRAAPALAYTQTPPLRPSLKSETQSPDKPKAGSVGHNSKNLFGVIFAIVILFICGVTICVVIPFILALLRSGGSG
jgi:hypothetical protein